MNIYETGHSKTDKMIYEPREDLDQPAHPCSPPFVLYEQ